LASNGLEKSSGHRRTLLHLILPGFSPAV